MLAHNGEVNTLEGNRNWMRARASQLESELLGGDIADILPIIRAGGRTLPPSTTWSSCWSWPAVPCPTP